MVTGAEVVMVPVPQVGELVLHDNGRLRDELLMWIVYPPEPGYGIIHCCLTTYKGIIRSTLSVRKKKGEGMTYIPNTQRLPRHLQYHHFLLASCQIHLLKTLAYHTLYWLGTPHTIGQPHLPSLLPYSS